MENYAAYSYPDSGNSSPRSREIDFENPPSSWDDQPLTSSNSNSSLNKVKFMVSYGGKIQPRPHDNQLAYVGGETKILAVDRSVRFPSLLSKLASLFPDAAAAGDLAFKYQLPGEDLDALISVTNDDDLDHLMHEHDRSCRSSKPARLRIFLFSAASSAAINLPSPTSTPPPVAAAAAAAAAAASAQHHLHHHGREVTTYGSTDSAKSSDRERMFVEALNSAAPPPPPLTATAPVAAPHQPTAVGAANNVDFLFGLEKGIGGGVGLPVPGAIHAQPPPPLQHQQQQQVYHHQQQVGVVGGGGGVPAHTTKLHDPISEPDYGGGSSDPQIDARIQELRRLQLSAVQQQQHQLQQQLQQQQQVLYHQQKNDENLLNVDPSYAQRFQHLQQQQQQPAYWGTQPEKSVGGTGGFQPTIGSVEQQPVYMIPATGGVYHAPSVSVMRPAAAAATSATTLGGQPQPGYFPVQRVAPEVYRDMPVYGIVSTAPPPTVPATVSPQGMGMQVRQMAAEMGGYVAYDSATGRQQVYYAAPGGGGGGGGGSGGSSGTVPYQVGVGAVNSSSGGAVVVNSDGRPAGGGDGVRTVTKVSNTSATL